MASCKNDDDWYDWGNWTNKNDCVVWYKLVDLRNIYNQVWDTLKREERQSDIHDGRKYGWQYMGYCQEFYVPESCEPAGLKGKNRREEIEDLASISGWINIELEYPWDPEAPTDVEYQNNWSIYGVRFIVDDRCEYLTRLRDQGDSDVGGCKCCVPAGPRYHYDSHQSLGNSALSKNEGLGEWIAYLKDPCYGCTAFLTDSRCINAFYTEDIVYRSEQIDVIERYYNSLFSVDECPISRHFQGLYGELSTLQPYRPIDNWQAICNLDIDWKVPSVALPIFRSVCDMFPQKIKCCEEDDPFTTVVENCCGIKAVAHWTEEWDALDQGSQYELCPQDDVDPETYAPGNIIRYVRRRIKHIDIHPPPGYFWSPNGKLATNGGSQFQGFVTQKIKANHLRDIWTKILDTQNGTELRYCKLPKCGYEWWKEPKDRDTSKLWVYGDTITVKGKNSLQERQKEEDKEDCDLCSEASIGSPICSCQWDDTVHMLHKFHTTTLCINELKSGCKLGKNKGEKDGVVHQYLAFGPNKCEHDTPCTGCGGLCCYDCKCEYRTEMDCLNIQKLKDRDGNQIPTPKFGPKWMGIYGYKDNCKSCEKRGLSKPCGGWEHPDPLGNLKLENFKICGTYSACCGVDGDKCNCLQLTACECQERGGKYTEPIVKWTEPDEDSDEEPRPYVTGVPCCDAKECRGGSSSRSFGYKDSDPPGKDFDECPMPGGKGHPDCEAGENPCIGESVSGFLKSVKQTCTKPPSGCKIQAKVYGGGIDNNGSAGGVSFNWCGDCETCKCTCDSIRGCKACPKIVSAQIEGSDGDWYFKIPFNANNVPPGGPYGAAGVSVLFFTGNQDPDAPKTTSIGLSNL